MPSHRQTKNIISTGVCNFTVQPPLAFYFVKQFMNKNHHPGTWRFLKFVKFVGRLSDPCLTVVHKITTSDTGKVKETKFSQSLHKVKRLLHYPFVSHFTHLLTGKKSAVQYLNPHESLTTKIRNFDSVCCIALQTLLPCCKLSLQIGLSSELFKNLSFSKS